MLSPKYPPQNRAGGVPPVTEHLSPSPEFKCKYQEKKKKFQGPELHPKKKGAKCKQMPSCYTCHSPPTFLFFKIQHYITHFSNSHVLLWLTELIIRNKTEKKPVTLAGRLRLAGWRPVWANSSQD
jgi:hypothetical protein